MAPPYQRIAEELRTRIAAGEFSPGSKLPSVRVIARRWKVAPGTAARALQSLVADGVARALPRSGVRVAGPVRPPERELSRVQIVRAAIRIADRGGLGALSVRGVAEELGVPAMSLYRHIESKDHLVTLMVDSALGEEPLPDVSGAAWRDGLVRLARAEWTLMRRHAWLSRALNISRPGTQPNALGFADRVMQALERTRLDATGKLTVHVMLHSFVQGLAVNVEAEHDARRESGIDEEAYMRGQEESFQTAALSGAFPHFARMLQAIPKGFDMDVDLLFERGIAALVEGLAPQIEDRRRPAVRRLARGR